MKSVVITIITLSLFIKAGLGNNDEELDLGNLLQMGIISNTFQDFSIENYF